MGMRVGSTRRSLSVLCITSLSVSACYATMPHGSGGPSKLQPSVLVFGLNLAPPMQIPQSSCDVLIVGGAVLGGAAAFAVTEGDEAWYRYTLGGVGAISGGWLGREICRSPTSPSTAPARPRQPSGEPAAAPRVSERWEGWVGEWHGAASGLVEGGGTVQDIPWRVIILGPDSGCSDYLVTVPIMDGLRRECVPISGGGLALDVQYGNRRQLLSMSANGTGRYRVYLQASDGSFRTVTDLMFTLYRR